MKAAFPFPLDAGDGPRKHIARLTELREKQAAAARNAKNRPPSVDDLLDDAESKLNEPGQHKSRSMSPPGGRSSTRLQSPGGQGHLPGQRAARRAGQAYHQPAQSVLLRHATWSIMVSRSEPICSAAGFVNPVDDFKNDPIRRAIPERRSTTWPMSSSPAATASRLRWCTDRQHRGLSAGPSAGHGRCEGAPRRSQQAFASATVRPMVGESLFDSIVQAVPSVRRQASRRREHGHHQDGSSAK